MPAKRGPEVRGPTVALPADFAQGPKFRHLAELYGRETRLLRDLFVQMYCLARLERTDGHVTEADVRWLVRPDSPRAAMRDVERLMKAGVVESDGLGGFWVPEYLADNPSREKEDQRTQARSEGVRQANHERWHVRRNDPDPACPWCQCTDQSTDQFTEQYIDQSTGQSTDSGDQAVLLEITPPIVPPTGGSVNGDSPEFTAFWQVYPKKAGKPRGRKAFRLALRKGHDPALITAAAERYAVQCQRERRDSRYIAHPSTWLNDERYLDTEEPASGGDDEDFWSR